MRILIRIQPLRDLVIIVNNFLVVDNIIIVYNVFELLIDTKLESHFIDCDGIDNLLAIVFKTNHYLVALLVKMVVDQLELPNAVAKLPVQTLVFLVLSNFQLAVELLDQGNLNAGRHSRRL